MSRRGFLRVLASLATCVATPFRAIAGPSKRATTIRNDFGTHNGFLLNPRHNPYASAAPGGVRLIDCRADGGGHGFTVGGG